MDISVLFTLENFTALLVIFILEMILGFDNLLYISIESGRASISEQERVRKLGIILAVVLRVILLAVTILLLQYFSEPLFTLDWWWLKGAFTLQTIIFVVGGAFLMYTAVKEIAHMLSLDDLHHDIDKKHSPTWRILTNILLMNIVFSFDSTLTAMAISKVFIVQAIGIISSGIAMYLIADVFAAFLARNRMYEVLGLFVLLIVGISLLGEGGHLAHMYMFNYAIEPLAKSTFYFSVAVLFMVELIQTRYQKKLEKERSKSQS